MQIKMASKCHVRSISLPSRSHPTTIRIEDELNRLNTWETSAVLTSESIFAGLSGLGDLYECVDDLLNMASTQQVLSMHRHEKCVDALLDGYVRLLDVCGIARDYMFRVKEHVRALQSALRRRKGDSSIENSILRYMSFRKEIKKNAKKLITELKRMDDGLDVSSCLDQDHHFSAVVRVLRQVNGINTSVFRSLFSFLSAPVPPKRTRRRSLVAKLMHKGVNAIACEEKQDNVNEIGSVDAALCRPRTFDVEKMQTARKRLVELESGIEGVENRLDCLFRHLIKARTSLLNIISQ